MQLRMTKLLCLSWIVLVMAGAPASAIASCDRDLFEDPSADVRVEGLRDLQTRRESLTPQELIAFFDHLGASAPLQFSDLLRLADVDHVEWSSFSLSFKNPSTTRTLLHLKKKWLYLPRLPRANEMTPEYLGRYFIALFSLLQKQAIHRTVQPWTTQGCYNSKLLTLIAQSEAFAYSVIGVLNPNALAEGRPHSLCTWPGYWLQVLRGDMSDLQMSAEGAAEWLLQCDGNGPWQTSTLDAAATAHWMKETQQRLFNFCWRVTLVGLILTNAPIVYGAVQDIHVGWAFRHEITAAVAQVGSTPISEQERQRVRQERRARLNLKLQEIKRELSANPTSPELLEKKSLTQEALARLSSADGRP